MIGWIDDCKMNGYWWLNELMYEEWIDKLMIEGWMDIDDRMNWWWKDEWILMIEWINVWGMNR